MTYGETFEMYDTPDGLDLFYSSNKNLVMITDTDKISQDVKFIFKTQVGEDMYNASFGMNIDVILNSKTPEMVVETVIREAIFKYRFFRKLKFVKVINKDYINRSMELEVGMVFNNQDIVFTLVI